MTEDEMSKQPSLEDWAARAVEQLQEQPSLEDWAARAVEQLQEIAGDLEDSGCDPTPEMELVREYASIMARTCHDDMLEQLNEDAL
jgi:hypothetical protein